MRSFMSRLTRALIGVTIILFVAVGVLFLVGGRPQQFNSQIVIAAPQALVFEYLTDPAIRQRWTSDGTQIQPLTEGGHRVGAKWRMTLQNDGRQLEFDCEVLESSPNERLICALIGTQLNARSDFRLQEDGGVTSLHHSLIVTPKGILRMFAPFSKDQIQAKLDGGLAQFKQVVERAARTMQLP